MSSLPAGAVRINLAGDGVEQYFYILELYILPALVVITVVLLCGYIAGRIFNRRSKNDAAAEQPSPELEKEEGTAAFLKELRSTPPIRDADSGQSVAMEGAGAAENNDPNHEEFAPFRLAPVGVEITGQTVTTESPTQPSVAPAPHAKDGANPAMTTESTAAALLARISRKKSASARRLSEVLDAPSEDTAAAPSNTDANAEQDGGSGFSALLADAKSEALDRVPEAMLLGEPPKEVANQPKSASPEQGAWPEKRGPLHAEIEKRRNNTPNFSLLAMVPDAGTETSDTAKTPARIPSEGTPFEDVLDLTMAAASEGFPKDDVLDLTHESSGHTPDDEALDLTDAADPDMPFEGALELLDETASNAPAPTDPGATPGATSDTTLELTQEISTSASLEGAPEPSPALGNENVPAALPPNGGLDLPQDLTPFMPSQAAAEDTPASIAESGNGGAAESETFTLPEDRSDTNPPMASPGSAPDAQAGDEPEAVEARRDSADTVVAAELENQEGAETIASRGDQEAPPELTPVQSAASDVSAAAWLNPFKSGSEEAEAESSVKGESADQPNTADQSTGQEADRSEQPENAPTHESLVDRILRREMPTNASVEDTAPNPSEPVRDSTPREALWATERPAAPVPAEEAAESAIPIGTPEPRATEADSNNAPSADAPPERTASPPDAFSDPLLLNELLGDGNFIGDAPRASETAADGVPSDVSNADDVETATAIEPDSEAPMPTNTEPAPSPERAVASKDVIDAEPEPTLVAPAAPAESVEITPSGNSMNAPDSPMVDAAGPPVVSGGDTVPDAAPDRSSTEAAPPSIVERPMIWHEGSAESASRADREDSVVEPWSTQPALQPRGVEDAQESVHRFSGEFQAAATALQHGMALLDEKIKAQKGLSLDDIGAMRVPGIDGFDDATDRLTDHLVVFGEDLGREIKEGAATLENINHVMDRLTEMAVAEDLDEGWNEIIRQRISEALYTVGKIQGKVAAVLPADDAAADKSEDSSAPSATGSRPA